MKKIIKNLNIQNLRRNVIKGFSDKKEKIGRLLPLPFTFGIMQQIYIFLGRKLNDSDIDHVQEFEKALIAVKEILKRQDNINIEKKPKNQKTKNEYIDRRSTHSM